MSLEEFNSNKDRSDVYEFLLRGFKTIKDPVHGDITLSYVETSIIDEKEYQRLRRIRQLGPVYLVYPGAQHTRFDHSIGTLHMAQGIVDQINRNAKKWEYCRSIDLRSIFIIRLVALLHDFVHLPYGHTLEDEGRLFVVMKCKNCGKRYPIRTSSCTCEGELELVNEKQYLDPDRVEKLFDKASGKIKEGIEEAFKEFGIKGAEGESKEVVRIIKDTLIAEEKGPEEINQLENPIFADIVGNTICADLLDYIKRDLYFTGLAGGYDNRIFSYFTCQEHNGKLRAVIKLNKKRKDFRADVLSGLSGLLHLRYTLAERIYYHHTKRTFSGIIIEMAEAAKKAGIISKDDLMLMNDDSFVYQIYNYKNNEENNSVEEDLSIAKKMAENYLSRNLYDRLFDEIIDEGRIKDIQNDWEMRYDTERTLEEILEVKKGDIIIYVPHKDMGAKRHWAALVEDSIRDRRVIKPLDRIAEEWREVPERREFAEIVESENKLLVSKHRSLWKVSVLVSKDFDEKKKEWLKKLLEDLFKTDTPSPTIVQLIAERRGINLEISQAMEVANAANKEVFTRPIREDTHKAISRIRRFMQNVDMRLDAL